MKMIDTVYVVLLSFIKLLLQHASFALQLFVIEIRMQLSLT